MADDTGVSGTPDAAGSSPAPSTASTPAESTPASATATPAAAPPDPGNAGGEPPRERWADILDNTRKKTRADVEAEYRQKYSRFDGFDENPYGFAESLLDQLAQHPQYEAQVLAKAARLLQSRRGRSTPEVEEPQPDVPIVDAQGRQTGQTYSATQLKKWQEWSWAQREAALNERLSPFEQLAKRIEQAEQVAQIQARSADHAEQTLAHFRKSDVFKQHEPKFKEYFAAHEEYGDNLDRAWWDFYQTQVLPTLSQTEQAKVLDSLQQKASATTVSPRGSAPTAKPVFKNFAEAHRYYAEHPEEAEAMANR